MGLAELVPVDQTGTKAVKRPPSKDEAFACDGLGRVAIEVLRDLQDTGNILRALGVRVIHMLLMSWGGGYFNG
jgi:hypothetical protein